MAESENRQISYFQVGMVGDGDPDSVAARALAGEPILVFPYGKYYRRGLFGDVQEIVVDRQVVGDAVRNFARRESAGVRQKLLPVNIDHNSSLGARGWFADVVELPEGLGARFNWNSKGQAALEAGEFAYFSLEFAWDLLDSVTGESSPHHVVGGALTNRPFFGQATALMSNIAEVNMSQNDGVAEIRQEVSGLREFIAGALSVFGRGAEGGDAERVAPTESGADPQAERFAALEAQVAEFSAQVQNLASERDAYAAKAETLQAQVGELQAARSAEKFAVMAAKFSHLPMATDKLAGVLEWLHGVPDNDGNVAAVVEVLSKADAEFARAFKAQGFNTGTGPQAVKSPAGQFDAQVQAYMAEHAPVSYGDAAQAVAMAKPELYAAYTEQIAGGA